MGGRKAISRLATCAALTSTVVSLALAAPAAADSDQYGNFLDLSSPCNPSSATVSVPAYPFPPAFANGVAWVDYFGIPVAVSRPFLLYWYGPRAFGATWSIPSPSSLLGGQYTLHVLLQGNGALLPTLYFVFTTLSETATIDPTLPYNCSATAGAASATTVRATSRVSSRRVVARRVRALRRDASAWLGRSLEERAPYPKARVCGGSICIRLRPGAAWQRVTQG